MFRILSIAVLLAASHAAMAGPAPQQTSASANAPGPSLASAQELAGKGHLEAAMAQLDQLAAQNPEPQGVERLRGLILYQKEQFPQAIDAFTKAAAEDPDDHESIEMHGVSLFRQGHIQEAIPLLEKARVGVQSANIDPEYVLALCYADVQRYDDSRHAFAKQYGFEPDSAEAYLLAGRQFLRRELRDEAGAEATKALELNPSLPLAHELLGEVALSRADLQTAIREFEAERKINPLNPDLYDRLGDAYLRAGQYSDALQSLNRAVLLEPQATGPYILLGEALLRLKQPIQALHYLDHAVRMDPSNFVTHNLLGQAYKATGQLNEANREFKLVVEIQHRNDPRPAGK
ncbi:MAG TPA: tetratricopeptide repeat protein [Terracidiphilus sp.]|jgi:tetratricopeptide (TPR) repeat protein